MGLSVRCIGDVRPIVGPRAHVQTEDRHQPSGDAETIKKNQTQRVVSNNKD